MITHAMICKSGGREVNEDSAGSITVNDAHLFAVADGLGGHSGGEVASKLVVDVSLKEFVETQGNGDLVRYFTKAQDELMELQTQQDKAEAMKTTLVLLRIDGNVAQWGHIGDSRLYVFKDGKVIAQTKDHSVPQMLVLTGDIKEEEIRNHPDRNRLLRVMGVEWESKSYELSGEIPLTQGVAFLLCSDGFWELIEEHDMCKLLKAAKTPEQWLALMEKRILKNGATGNNGEMRLRLLKKDKRKNMDNYTALAVWVD